MKTNGTYSIKSCQICSSSDLESGLFLGYLPPVNQMRTIGSIPEEQAAYPAQVLICSKCQLVQLGLVVDQNIIFPPEYPYRSGTTRILRENFADLFSEVSGMISITKDDLAVDIGSNDGTLLSNFVKGGIPVLGIEPTQMGELANKEGVRTIIKYFNLETAKAAAEEYGKAKVVTAANVFAHIDDVHNVIDGILTLLEDDGIFVSESHYWISLVDTLQYDTIYHEHLRYYSLNSLAYLFKEHGLEIIHAKPIPTHGGSIRVYAARKGKHKVQSSVAEIFAKEAEGGELKECLARFSEKVMMSKLALHSMLHKIKQEGKRVFGIGAPSRASTLINYVGIDQSIMDCVLEIGGSPKLGKYMPGTLIPVEDEKRLFDEQPDYALLLSWHIAEELMPKLKEKGFKGKFIVPLPEPHII